MVSRSIATPPGFCNPGVTRIVDGGWSDDQMFVDPETPPRDADIRQGRQDFDDAERGWRVKEDLRGSAL
jgi:hypothetical protein